MINDTPPSSHSQSSSQGYGQYGPDDCGTFDEPVTLPWAQTVTPPLDVHSAAACGAASSPAAAAAAANPGIR